MRRQLFFDYAPDENQYLIQEEDKTIFVINGDTLRFASFDFYNGLYAGNKSTAIDFKNRMSADPLKKGGYIFSWIAEIIKSIEDELPELEDVKHQESELQLSSGNQSTAQGKKIIPLFEWPACAGDGFYFDQANVPFEKIEVENLNADYAVRISGKSMEPTIMDGSTVLVKQVEDLLDGDIGIFNVNGEIMCKRYIVNGEKIILKPDNESGMFSNIDTSQAECILQGKVLLNLN